MLVGPITDEMRDLVNEQMLGFVASVRSDGTPNLSPKGTTRALDDEHLVFADLRSPQTIENIRGNPWVEVNVVDPFVRKGFRFKGTAEIIEEGPALDRFVSFFAAGPDGVTNARERIRRVVIVKVEEAAPLTSPAYDLGMSEQEVVDQWRAYWNDSLRRRGYVANG